MSVERDAMIKSLKIVIPILRERGFKGSFPHFYRKLVERADLMMFQFSMWGGALFVRILRSVPQKVTPAFRKISTPNKMKVYYVGDGSAWHRFRIGM